MLARANAPIPSPRPNRKPVTREPLLVNRELRTANRERQTVNLSAPGFDAKVAWSRKEVLCLLRKSINTITPKGVSGIRYTSKKANPGRCGALGIATIAISAVLPTKGRTRSMMRLRQREAILNVTILPTTKCNKERPLVWAVAAAPVSRNEPV